MEESKTCWEFEGDWYIQPNEGLMFCVNTEGAAQKLLELLNDRASSEVNVKRLVIPQIAKTGKYNAIELFNDVSTDDMRIFDGYRGALKDLKNLGVIIIEPLPLSNFEV